MMKKIVMVIGVILLMLPVLTSAGQNGSSSNNGQYEFVKGKGVEICEAYYKNLLDNPADDIRCERDFNPELKDFKKTNWEKLDIVENKEIVWKIKKFITHGDQFTEKDVYFGLGLEEESMQGLISMYFARIDINNDGKLENVVRYSEGGNDNMCMNARVFVTVLLVLTEDKTMIDVEKTELLLQNIPDPLPSPSSINYQDIKIKATNNDGEIYDIFAYKNTIYFDKWNADYSKLYDVTVYTISNKKAKTMCKYKCVHGCEN